MDTSSRTSCRTSGTDADYSPLMATLEELTEVLGAVSSSVTCAFEPPSSLVDGGSIRSDGVAMVEVNMDLRSLRRRHAVVVAHVWSTKLCSSSSGATTDIEFDAWGAGPEKLRDLVVEASATTTDAAATDPGRIHDVLRRVSEVRCRCRRPGDAAGWRVVYEAQGVMEQGGETHLADLCVVVRFAARGAAAVVEVQWFLSKAECCRRASCRDECCATRVSDALGEWGAPALATITRLLRSLPAGLLAFTAAGAVRAGFESLDD